MGKPKSERDPGDGKSDWHGEIDLNNQELLTKFKNYVVGQK